MTEENPILARMRAVIEQHAAQNAQNARDQADIESTIRREVDESNMFLANTDTEFIVMPPVKNSQEAASWLDTLPAADLALHEFLIEIDFEDEHIICCFCELTWPAALDIESRSYRKNNRQGVYFSGDYERRETLKQAIKWVAATKSQQLDYNTDGCITRRLNQDVVNALWGKYCDTIEIGSDEAVALYESAQSYFMGKSQQGHPTPSLVIEVDAMLCGLASMTRTELRSLTRSDMERIQLIKMARAEALGLIPIEQQPVHHGGRSHTQIDASLAARDEIHSRTAAAYGGNFYPPNATN